MRCPDNIFDAYVIIYAAATRFYAYRAAAGVRRMCVAVATRFYAYRAAAGVRRIRPGCEILCLFYEYAERRRTTQNDAEANFSTF